MSEAHSLRPSARSSAAEVLVVGLPFCAFKIVTGVTIATLPAWKVFGIFLVAFGLVDAAINILNLLSLTFVKRRVTELCVLDLLVRRFDRRTPSSDLGIALDIFVSFGLVAAVVGFGLFSRMPTWANTLWNVAVVLNVLGAGVGRLYGSLRHRFAKE